jgi:dihydroflavonol-4-reductase
VTDLLGVRRAVVGCEAVVHAAAVYSYSRSDWARAELVNVLGTRNVLESVARSRVRRLVLTSTSATCGPVHGRPATERDHAPAWDLRVPYKRTKLAAERLALAAAREGIDVVCVNPTTVLGPGDRRPTPSGKMIRDLVEGRIPAYIAGAGLNVVGVADVARGHAQALELGRSGERYILGGDDLSLRDAFALASAGIGHSPPRVPLPWSPVFAAALAVDAAARLLAREPQLLVLHEVLLARQPLFFSSAKARDELGYRSRPASDALATTARWFAATGDASRATATTRLAASGS